MVEAYLPKIGADKDEGGDGVDVPDPSLINNYAVRANVMPKENAYVRLQVYQVDTTRSHIDTGKAPLQEELNGRIVRFLLGPNDLAVCEDDVMVNRAFKLTDFTGNVANEQIFRVSIALFTEEATLI